MVRDVEKIYSKNEFVRKLKRLAQSLEKNARFTIQVAGKKVIVPKTATISVEHEKAGQSEEIEFQIKWKNK